MKKSLFLVLLLSHFFGFAQYTLIPDVNFEKALIKKLIDTGTPDGKVLTANISGLNDLNVFDEGITDLTGLENFVSLKTLLCGENLFLSIDLSKNTSLEYLDCQQSKLTSLDVSKNLKLTNLVCEGSQLTNLDVSKNTALKYLNCGGLQSNNLDVSKNTVLVTLICRRSQLTSLDVSNNKSLLYIDCIYNNLINLNLKNGNNATMGGAGVLLQFNPNLNCIQVDNAVYSDANWSYRKDSTASFSEICSKTTTTIAPPVITATGNQTYCPGTSLKIVETISITNDPAEPGTNAVYIQISSGYINGQDLLTLANPIAHPTIITSWDAAAGKLKLYSPTGIKIPYIDFVSAIKDVEFSNSSASPSGIRNFSINLGQANYLPSTGHYYQFVSNVGITWTNAKAAAEASTYYGLKGYLATLLSADEAKLSGEQASGAGWIGGSDAAKEGEWRWVTGPEGLANGGTGIIFWNGTGGGSTPNFAYWNTMNNEPNQAGDEDYAHITAPGVGIPGSWNDLSNTGNLISGNAYQPKGYIVEYGGMLGDPTLHISASTTITIPKITSTNPNSRCDSGNLSIQATATDGIVSWYTASTGGTPIATGTNFTTPTITSTTTYYVDATIGCTNPTRTAITATINTTPTITSTAPASRCGSGTVKLGATASAGIINWYSQIGGTVIGTGLSYTTPIISANTAYFAEALSDGCTSAKTQIDVLVYPLPAVTDETVKKCNSSTATLDASIPNMTYLWNTGETTQTIKAPTTGIYTVEVTSLAPEKCTSKKTITVIEDNKPEIKNVKVDETTVIIELIKNEDYFEYSIDGTDFQSSNVFMNAPSGLQTAYVRDINKCSSDKEPFIVIIVPKFFTPNNDNQNDVWEVKGLADYPLGQVMIFDRYGKTITQLNHTNQSWDGTFNKNPLPSSDYWYILKLDPNSPEVKGHFSLKR